MKHKLPILFLLMCTANGLFAQNIDSLLVVANRSNDSVYVTLHNFASYYLIFNDKERAAKTLKAGKTRALKAKFYYGLTEITNTEGVYYDVIGKQDSAKVYFTKALQLSRKHNYDGLETRITNNLGMFSWNQGNFNAALNYFFKALQLNEKLPKEKKILESIMLSNIGLIYQEMNLFDKALVYHKKAYDSRKEKNMRLELPVSLNNMGICYERLEKRALAEKSYKEGLTIAKEIGNFSEYYKLLENYAGILVAKAQYKEAIALLLEALHRPAEVAMSEKTRFSLYSELANGYNNLQQPKTALGYGLKGLAVLKENPDLENFSADLYLGLSHSYYKLGDEVNGQIYAVKFADATRARFSSDNAQELADLEVRFETEKKEKLLAENKANILKMEAEAKQKNYIMMIASFFILFLSIIGYLLYRQQRLKNRQMEKEFQLKSALAEIENQNRLQEQRLSISRDLHDNIGAQLTFIISTLDSLKFRLQDNVPAVGTKLEGISNFTRQTIIELRDTIWAMNTDHITFEDLRVRILNFIDKAKEANEEIDFKFRIDPSLTNLELTSIMGMNIYRTIQEAVNNTIKHAGATNLEIIVFDETDKVGIVIKDNGKGFNSVTVTPGNGLGNMEKRIEDIGGDFSLISSTDEGTLIKINLSKQMQSA